MNFKFNYTGEDDTPVKLDLGLGKQEANEMIGSSPNSKKQSSSSKIDIYDSDSIIFIEPMFMVDTSKFQNYTIKLSLEKFIEKQRNMCRQAICLLNRTNNKSLFLQYLYSLLLNKKLNLFSSSMIFMKICQVYKQASLERQSIRKRAQ